ncbi:MAG TPA: hypothetical protein VFV31_14630 [Chitinophagaceae bacterium]|nr:hypothetical protein [Chitinophagaceae bacterium]
MNRYLIVFLFSFLAATCLAQYDSMLHKTFLEKRPLLSDFYRNKLKIRDQSFAGKKPIIAALRSFGQKHKDPSLVAEADYATAWLQMLESPDTAMQTELMYSFIANQAKQKQYWMVARAYRTMGENYWSKAQNYQRAFESYFEGIEAGKPLAHEEYPEKMLDYSSLGYAYYFFKEYRQAIVYLKEAISFTPPAPMARAQSDIRNNLGLCYQKLGMLDSSDYYFSAILTHKTDLHEQWVGIASGNLGYNQYLRGHYREALPLLQKDIDAATQFNDPGLASGSLVPMADIYLKQNNIARAEELALLAKSDIEKAGDYSRYEYLYPFLSKLYAAKGNSVLAQQFLDSSLQVKDSLDRKFNAMQLARAQQIVESARRQQEILGLEKEKENKIIQRNLLIGFVVLLTILALYIFRLVKKKHRQEQLLKDLTLHEKEKELQAADQQLKDFAFSVSEKSKLLEELENQLKLKGSEDEKLILQLQQTTLLTDEQWNHFRQLFEKVHSGFLYRLRQKLPDLTPAETRYMALAKLQFSTKEMAAALGISQQTVRVTTHRLRKKLQLPEEGSLPDLVNSI